MRHKVCTVTRDGHEQSFKWIAHVMDHFTKFHVVWPLVNKCADEVAEGLERHVFAYFGLPSILQSDNGREFKNALVAELIQSWEGNCKIIHGRPRHPQSQGLVEQANGTLERMLASMMEQENHKNWVKLLPKATWSLNSQTSSCMLYSILNK